MNQSGPTPADSGSETLEEAAATEADSAAPADEALADELQAARAEAEAAQDRYLRALADLDNLRRRSRNEIQEARRFAAESLLRDLLEVVDDFERALLTARSAEDTEALGEGVELIERRLREILARHGVVLIEALGKPFDPHLHEAVATAPPTDDQEAGTVVEELRRGYRLHDRVLRPSLVKIAQH